MRQAGSRRNHRMSQQTEDIKNTGSEAAQKLRALFETWALEDAEASYEDEPS